MGLVSWLLAGLADLVVPPRCGACGAASEGGLCSTCRAGLALNREPDPQAPHLAASVAAVAYAGEVPGWLQRFKYPRAGLAGLDAAPIGVLCGLAAEAARCAPGPAPDLVVPVPLHVSRLRARGFNPAVALARAVAAETRAPCARAALERTRDTPSQTGLDRAARRHNVAGAFRCRRPMPETVWLVDDVLTTGATLSACARALRGGGARRVVAVCVARTPLTSEATEADDRQQTKPLGHAGKRVDT